MMCLYVKRDTQEVNRGAKKELMGGKSLHGGEGKEGGIGTSFLRVQILLPYFKQCFFGIANQAKRIKV